MPSLEDLIGTVVKMAQDSQQREREKHAALGINNYWGGTTSNASRAQEAALALEDRKRGDMLTSGREERQNKVDLANLQYAPGGSVDRGFAKDIGVADIGKESQMGSADINRQSNVQGIQQQGMNALASTAASGQETRQTDFQKQAHETAMQQDMNAHSARLKQMGIDDETVKGMMAQAQAATAKGGNFSDNLSNIVQAAHENFGGFSRTPTPLPSDERPWIKGVINITPSETADWAGRTLQTMGNKIAPDMIQPPAPIQPKPASYQTGFAPVNMVPPPPAPVFGGPGSGPTPPVNMNISSPNLVPLAPRSPSLETMGQPPPQQPVQQQPQNIPGEKYGDINKKKKAGVENYFSNR